MMALVNSLFLTPISLRSIPFLLIDSHTLLYFFPTPQNALNRFITAGRPSKQDREKQMAKNIRYQHNLAIKRKEAMALPAYVSLCVERLVGDLSLYKFFCLPHSGVQLDENEEQK